METPYRKVEIKSKQDLPKEKDKYFVKLKHGIRTVCNFHSRNHKIWMERVEYYLQPIEPQEERIPNVGKTIELREELINFARQFYADEETCIHNVDQYLTSKKP